IWILREAGDRALPALRVQFLTNLPANPTREWLGVLVRGLNSNLYRTPQGAIRELRGAGAFAYGFLARERQRPPTEEFRRRAELLLSELKDDPQVVIYRRVFQLLREIGTTRARALLTELSERIPNYFE